MVPVTIRSEGAARPTLPGPVAVVLGGGGSLGARQVGGLLAIREAGIAPDLLVGSSVGALNAALVALDPDRGAQRLAELWLTIKREDIFVPVRPPGSRRATVFDPSGLRALVESVVEGATFADTRVLLGIVVTDPKTLAPVVLHEGPLAQALMASTAIPLLFPPVRVGRHRYVDGGYSSPMPVRAALQRGARTVLTLAAGGVPRVFWDPPGRNLVASGTVVPLVDTVIRERRPGDFLDFRNSAALIASGREQALEVLDRSRWARSRDA